MLAGRCSTPSRNQEECQGEDENCRTCIESSRSLNNLGSEQFATPSSHGGSLSNIPATNQTFIAFNFQGPRISSGMHFDLQFDVHFDAHFVFFFSSSF